MNKLFLYFFFTAAFMALVLTASYLLVVAGAKYNGEDTSLGAIYNRARNAPSGPVVVPRNFDSTLAPPTELERINQENLQYQQAIQESPGPSPNYVDPYTNPYGSGL